jgi:hypothetical protein
LAESNSRSVHSVGWLLVIPAIAMVALVLNGLAPSARRSRLFFPDESGTKLIAETRQLDLMGSIEERSVGVLDELMLGPFGTSLRPLFKQDATLRVVMYRGGRLHVNLDIPDLGGLDFPFGIIRSAIEKSITDSVPGAGSLELYVNGFLTSH